MIGRLAGGLLLIVALLPGAPLAERVKDSAGREVVIEAPVERVFAAGPPAAILVYTVDPEALLGWTRPLPEKAGQYMPERFHGLPVLGRLTGRGGSANVEVVLATQPDVILDYGAVNPTYISLADRIQSQLNIPYVLLDGSLERLPEAYRRLGELLGRPERADRLARYVEELLAQMQALRNAVPPQERPRVYYGRSGDGLDTALPGAINVEVLELVGARNVAEAPGRGVVSISLEQVLAWDPDVILTIDRNFRREIESAPGWSQLRAVRADRVYLAPELPFPWFDRPPSSNRLIGARWLAHLLYPGRVEGELREQVREFYRLFYQHELTEAELDDLLDEQAR
jgi:iron complex transport system substrate-binding protein